MADFLLEIGVEELPSSYVDIGVSTLKEKTVNLLESEGIHIDQSSVVAVGTPRRLGIVVKGLPEKTAVTYETLKGPPKQVSFGPDGSPTKALTSFLQKTGANMDDLVELETEKGIYMGVKKKTGGKSIKDVLSSSIPSLVRSITFPKNMRWDDSGLVFGRPIRWLVALLGEEVLPVSIGKNISSGRVTKGHRFTGNSNVNIKDPLHYENALRENGVEPSKEKRKSLIRSYLESCNEKGLFWVRDEELLEEVSNLVEYPYPVMGTFSDQFLSLPDEVVVNVLRSHQKFFCFRKAEGTLSSHFLGVSNNRPTDEIRRGYERVVEARLDDALFFMNEDLKLPFGDKRLEKLKSILFHSKLGSMYDKTVRLVELCEFISKKLSLGDEGTVRRASLLSKMDLTTHMVYEFPELQGVMGREYAKRLGEPLEVAEALYEQYLPRFVGDRIPESPCGMVLSLGDKIDSLVGFFGVGELPKSSGDPYGLRRAALGVFLVTIERGLRYSLSEFLETSRVIYEKAGIKLPKRTVDSVSEFIKTRMQNYYLSSMGFKKDAVNAVFSLKLDDLYSYHLRMIALGEERDKEDFMEVFLPFKRAANISKEFEGGDVNPSLFERPEEEELYKVYLSIKERFDEMLKKEDFKGILSLFREIKPYVDKFFDNVFVMVEDEKIRSNRLAILKNISDMFSKAFDFSKFFL